MKKINKYLLALVSVVTFILGACTDSVDYDPASPVEGQGVYFPNTLSGTVELKGAEGKYGFELMRVNADEAATVGLEVKFENEDAASLFTVPSTVSFAAGENKATVAIDYQNLVMDVNYKMTLSVSNGNSTEYADGSKTFTMFYPNPVSWQLVTDKAAFKENIMSAAFSVSEVVLTNVRVEKQVGKEIYRIVDIFNDDYPYNDKGDYLGVKRYIVLDCETYSDPAAEMKTVYVPFGPLGHDWSYGEFEFGSVAYNLYLTGGVLASPEDFPLGTYDAKNGIFKLGACALLIPSEKSYAPTKTESVLYLDPSKMIPDYDNDYTWKKVGKGTFTSSWNGKYDQSIEVSLEDPTLYRLPSIYTEKGNLVFFYDAENGTLTVPKDQFTGVEMLGVKVYMSSGAGTSVDTETRTFSFGLSLYTLDENGNKLGEISKVNETFVWEEDVESYTFDDLTPAASIDDYCGTYTTLLTKFENGAQDEFPVTLTKTEDDMIAVRGLAPMHLDGFEEDVVLLGYADGYLVFQAQIAGVNDYGEVMALPINTATNNIFTESMIFAGITPKETVAFVNYPGNENEVDAFAFMFNYNGGTYIADEYMAANIILEKTTDANKVSHAKSSRSKILTPWSNFKKEKSCNINALHFAPVKSGVAPRTLNGEFMKNVLFN